MTPPAISRRVLLSATVLGTPALLIGCSTAQTDATLARVKAAASAFLALVDKYKSLVPANIYATISENVAAILKLTGGDWLTIARGAADLLVKAVSAVLPLLPLPASIVTAAQTAIAFVQQVFAPAAAFASPNAPALVTGSQADAALAELTTHAAAR